MPAQPRPTAWLRSPSRPGRWAGSRTWALWLAGVQGVCPPTPPERVAVVVFAGDHGVTATPDTVSAYPREVTAAMVGEFLRGGAGGQRAGAGQRRPRAGAGPRRRRGRAAGRGHPPQGTAQLGRRRPGGRADRRRGRTVARRRRGDRRRGDRDRRRPAGGPATWASGTPRRTPCWRALHSAYRPTTSWAGAPGSTTRPGFGSARSSPPRWSAPDPTARTPSRCSDHRQRRHRGDDRVPGPGRGARDAGCWTGSSPEPRRSSPNASHRARPPGGVPVTVRPSPPTDGARRPRAGTDPRPRHAPR